MALDLAADSILESLAGSSPPVTVVDESVEPSLIAHVKAVRPRAPLVVIARQPSPLLGAMLLNAGVSCLALDVATELAGVVRAAAAGDFAFIPAEGTRVTRVTPEGVDLLTARERQVFVRFRQGMSYAQIALQMCISETTVKSHSRSIRRKLNVPTKRHIEVMV